MICGFGIGDLAVLIWTSVGFFFFSYSVELLRGGRKKEEIEEGGTLPALRCANDLACALEQYSFSKQGRPTNVLGM